MSLICHLVLDSYNASRGGLAQSAVRIAAHLAGAACRVYAYSLHPDDVDIRPDWPQEVEPVALGHTKQTLLKPFEGSSPNADRDERFAADYLALRGAIIRRLNPQGPPSPRHLIVSLHLSRAGFVSQHVADSLGLPHLASVRGSDFTRDFKYPGRFAAFGYVVNRSRGLITTNEEQRTTLNTIFGCGPKTATIYNSVDLASGEWHRPPQGSMIRIVSDCGYSFKKGTHLLLGAFESLLSEGLPVQLVLAGPTEEKRYGYWENLKQELSERLGGATKLQGWLPLPIIRSMLAEGHLYASATLSEGSSNARLTALAYGMPIVSTRCGELADLASDAEHISLCSPGDFDEFRTALQAAVTRLVQGNLTISKDIITNWRHILDPAIERTKWCAAVKRAADE